ncbi:MAG: hypothetical protein HN863_12375 [Marinovum sp.]|nr:hypothetical protein [Marinovum sp.]
MCPFDKARICGENNKVFATTCTLFNREFLRLTAWLCYQARAFELDWTEQC